MISDVPYRTSTQYRLFSFPSKESLHLHRSQNTQKSAAQLPPGTNYLTTEEESEIVDFYVGRLWNFCGLFKVSSNVKVNNPSIRSKLTYVGRRNSFPSPILPT